MNICYRYKCLIVRSNEYVISKNSAGTFVDLREIQRELI